MFCVSKTSKHQQPIYIPQIPGMDNVFFFFSDSEI